MKGTTEDFIRRSIEKHGDKFDYSESVYDGWLNQIGIICPYHGRFITTPRTHLSYTVGGCADCRTDLARQRYGDTQEEFLKKAIGVHGDKYEYDLVVYLNNKTEITIRCCACGYIFDQTPNAHLVGCGCPACAARAFREYQASTRKSESKFIEDSISVWGEGAFDYSDVDYQGSHSSIALTCLKHNILFSQDANSHLKGINGCPKCDKRKQPSSRRKSTEQFVQEAREVHGDRYDYSLSDYRGGKTKVVVICSRHGQWEVKPDNHIVGGNGCPRCKATESRGETAIAELLDEWGIQYIRQMSFDECRYKNKLFFDFAVVLDEFNFLLIEYQGYQHYHPVTFGNNGKDGYEEQVKRDRIKVEFAEKKNIPLLFVPYWDYDNIESILRKELSDFI